jgi:hypothetical protein
MPTLAETQAVGPRRPWARTRADVLTTVARRLAEDHLYGFYFRDVTFKYASGVLTLRGRVPTDRLKQALHWRLANIDGVDEIDDRIDVISSCGLSCIHPK